MFGRRSKGARSYFGIRLFFLLMYTIVPKPRVPHRLIFWNCGCLCFYHWLRIAIVGGDRYCKWMLVDWKLALTVQYIYVCLSKCDLCMCRTGILRDRRELNKCQWIQYSTCNQTFSFCSFSNIHVSFIRCLHKWEQEFRSICSHFHATKDLFKQSNYTLGIWIYMSVKVLQLAISTCSTSWSSTDRRLRLLRKWWLAKDSPLNVSGTKQKP